MEEELRQAAETDISKANQDLASVLDRMMDLPKRDWSQYSPLTLAWIGDTVYDLIVRSILLKREKMQPDKLHKKASKVVNARAQAELIRSVRDKLSDREESIYRRGRNAKPAHKAKNADTREYLEATGFECLLGYLYLTGQNQRIMELILEGGAFAHE